VAGLLLVAAVVLAYLPALRAGWIWDDDSYVTANPILTDPEGWMTLWIPGRTPQYYPLVFLSFWIERAIWGEAPAGYHLVNVLLHASCALLLWRILRRIGIRFAWLAAAIFALHPLAVESVAWVTERKNVLSLLMALAALRAWLFFEPATTEASEGSCATDGPATARLSADRGSSADPAPGGAPAQRPRAGWYGLSLFFFVAALLSKTTAVALPVAIVLLRLHQRRRWSLRSLGAISPFFAMGMAAGLVTAWVERTHVGAAGAEFDRTVIERVLTAARAFWFYPAQWVWPRELLFVYPRWSESLAEASGWAAVAAGAALGAWGILLYRRGRRAALLLILLYGAGVFPSLGFIDVYPHRYSFVADHFAYVALIPLAIATAWALSAGATRGSEGPGGSDAPDPNGRRQRSAAPARAAGGRRRAVRVITALLLLMLAGRSYVHARHFMSAESLWTHTLRGNPGAWLASGNLAAIALQRAEAARADGDAGGVRSAAEAAWLLAEQGVRSSSERDIVSLGNRAEAERLLGRAGEAIATLDAALKVKPDAGHLHWARGRLLETAGDHAGAAAAYERSAELRPEQLAWLGDAGRALARAGELSRARDVWKAMIRRQREAPILANLGGVQLALGEVGEARMHLREALEKIDAAERAVPIALRLIEACLREPHDPQWSEVADRLSAQLVEATGGGEPLALALRARVLAQVGRMDEARVTLDLATKAQGEDPPQPVREAIAAARAACAP